MRKTISKCVDVDVDVEIDLEDFDTADLVAEIEERRKTESIALSEVGTPPLNSENTHPLHEIYYAFKFGLTERATELARAYVCDELGVVL